MSLIYYSAKESELASLRIGRGGRIVSFNPNYLKQEILVGQYDICRLKVRANDEELFNRFRQVGFPFFLYSVIVRNSVQISAADLVSIDSNLEFELYNGTRADALGAMIRNSILQRSATNYKRGLFENLIPVSVELDAAVHYYTTEFSGVASSNKIGWLVKDAAQYIGFVLCEITANKKLEGIFYGIDPTHRGSKKHARTIMQFLKKHSAENGLTHFENDVVVPNFPSWRSIVGENVLPVEAYINVVFYPCLQASGISTATLPSANGTVSLDAILMQIQKSSPTSLQLTQMHRQVLRNPLEETNRQVQINRLTSDDSGMLYTAKYFEGQELTAIDYFEMKIV